MASERRNGEPTELSTCHRRRGSRRCSPPASPGWSPLFTWWPYGVVGAVVALAALWAWIRNARREFARLPREQRITAAVIPRCPRSNSAQR